MAPRKRYQWQDGALRDDDDSPSRSEKKRRSTALQALGEEVAALSPAAQADLPLGPDMREALALLARITDREGRRRQLQFIGRLMREENADAIREALAARAAGHQADTARFHRAEHWRDRLLQSPDASLPGLLDALPDALPGADAALLARLRELIPSARTEQGAPHARRELFRLLMQGMSAPATPGAEKNKKFEKNA
ncbi:ribosome biogenesis factor YjgA [uncultured Desulfovibrio sp.]|uniref:ribosome biogenesis factor YjgA n=1 Tax=uncultured Desulfovibrio sp. TaxID=167968 RepID=UPI002632632A|nr:ribosome biogenesis factor YjgA [uncultured Desulfovibrio sp.]